MVKKYQPIYHYCIFVTLKYQHRPQKSNIKSGSNCLTLLLQQIMKDRWINAGFEEDELKPYTEPELDITDQRRIGKKKKKKER